jgi:hypothetical protein
MKFHECEPRGVPDFVLRQGKVSSLWGFHHLPKTAGSSLVATLERDFGPYYNIFARPDLAPNLDYRALLTEATRAFVELQMRAPPERKIRSFSGHLFRMHLNQIREAFSDVRLFTILREPTARAVSDYRYRMTPSHPGHREFAQAYPTIIDYVRDFRNQNIMIKMLAPFHPAFNRVGPPLDPNTVIAEVLSFYEFVGTVEALDASIEIAFALMGAEPGPPLPRLNVTNSIVRNQVDLTEAVVEEIRAANTFDFALYDHVARALVPRIAAWRERSVD